MVNKTIYTHICSNYKGKCLRVRAGIECPECGYPIGEAMFGLKELWPNSICTFDVLPENDPGHTT